MLRRRMRNVAKIQVTYIMYVYMYMILESVHALIVNHNCIRIYI